jgi:hypothetical protein
MNNFYRDRDKLRVIDSSISKLRVISITAGSSTGFRFFSIYCAVTDDYDAKPTTVRLRFFSVLPKVTETFATDWVPLPNINSLPFLGRGEGPQFFFSGGTH